MRRAFALVVLLTIPPGVSACMGDDSEPDDTALDEAIAQYVAQRAAEAEAACQCFALFLDTSGGFAHGMFTSEDQCLQTLGAAPLDEALVCMKAVLESSGIGMQAGVDAVNCYAATTADTTHCYVNNAEQCSPVACSSDTVTKDECQGELTADEASALWDCVWRG